MGGELSTQMNAYELNALSELNQIAASEREALQRAELEIASHEVRISQEEHAAGLRARATAVQSEAYWHAEAVASATRAHHEMRAQTERHAQAEEAAVTAMRAGFLVMEHNLAEESARREAEQRRVIQQQLEDHVASRRDQEAAAASLADGPRCRGGLPAMSMVGFVPLPPTAPKARVRKALCDASLSLM